MRTNSELPALLSTPLVHIYSVDLRLGHTGGVDSTLLLSQNVNGVSICVLHGSVERVRCHLCAMCTKDARNAEYEDK